MAVATAPTALLSGQSSGSDIDGDGIPDQFDLDADGDGVLDVDEYGPCATGGQVVWNHNGDGGQSDAAIVDANAAPHITAATDITFGRGLVENPDFANTYLIGGADQPDLAGAQFNGDYVQYSVTPAVPLVLDYIYDGFFTGSGSVQEAGLGNFQMAIEFATLADFSDGTVLGPGLQVPALFSSFGYDPNNPTADGPVPLMAGVEYFFRVYFFDEQNDDPQDRVRFDDHFWNFSVTESCFLDSDDDGIPDHLDLDQDGDGVLDVPPPTTTTTTTVAPTTTTTTSTTTTAPPVTTTEPPVETTTTTTTPVAPTTTEAPATTEAPTTTTTTTAPPATTEAVTVVEDGAAETTTTTTAAPAVSGDVAEPPVLALTGPSDDPIAAVGILSVALGGLILLLNRVRRPELG